MAALAYFSSRFGPFRVNGVCDQSDCWESSLEVHFYVVLRSFWMNGNNLDGTDA